MSTFVTTLVRSSTDVAELHFEHTTEQGTHAAFVTAAVTLPGETEPRVIGVTTSPVTLPEAQRLLRRACAVLAHRSIRVLRSDDLAVLLQHADFSAETLMQLVVHTGSCYPHIVLQLN